jgi:pyruvate formate lyase activating enzyme
MLITGLQKLTLLDYPQKVAATVFTPGCNFCCPFCHNAPLVLDPHNAPIIPEEEVLMFLESRKGLLDGVCISGGEPLMQDGIVDFIMKVKRLGFMVKVDTNGSYFDRLEELIDNKLVDYIAMDIKNSPEKYEATSSATPDMMDDIKKSVGFLLEGKVDYEFRTTVVKEFHDEDDFLDIGRWIEGAKTYVLQNFEDSDNVIQSGLSSVGSEKLRKFADIVRPFVCSVQIRGI